MYPSSPYLNTPAQAMQPSSSPGGVEYGQAPWHQPDAAQWWQAPDAAAQHLPPPDQRSGYCTAYGSMQAPQGAPMPMQVPQGAPMLMQVPQGAPMPMQVPQDAPMPMQVPQDAYGNWGAAYGTSIMEQPDILSEGMRGEHVRQWQIFLMHQGFSVGPSGADGVYGPATTNATRAFQQANQTGAITGAVNNDTMVAAGRLGYGRPLEGAPPSQPNRPNQPAAPQQRPSTQKDTGLMILAGGLGVLGLGLIFSSLS